MKWKKLGLIYNSDGKFGWNKIGAFLPTAEVLSDSIRVYVAMHDEDMTGRIGYVDVDINDPTRIIYVSKQPVLDIGIPGTFDDSGVTPASVLSTGVIKILYYVGWCRGVNVRYTLFPGIAIWSNDENKFIRTSPVPFLDRIPSEMFLRTAPSVIYDSLLNIYRMWYVGGSEWFELNGKLVPKYNMYTKKSDNLMSWNQGAGQIVAMANDEIFGYGRPQVIISNSGLYEMFYSIRYKDKGYRLGYKTSSTGIHWEDKDIGIDVSESGWDSESLSFASVVDVYGDRYMFYNGSHGGRTGFGVAILEKE